MRDISEFQEILFNNDTVTMGQDRIDLTDYLASIRNSLQEQCTEGHLQGHYTALNVKDTISLFKVVDLFNKDLAKALSELNNCKKELRETKQELEIKNAKEKDTIAQLKQIRDLIQTKTKNEEQQKDDNEQQQEQVDETEELLKSIKDCVENQKNQLQAYEDMTQQIHCIVRQFDELRDEWTKTLIQQYGLFSEKNKDNSEKNKDNTETLTNFFNFNSINLSSITSSSIASLPSSITSLFGNSDPSQTGVSILKSKCENSPAKTQQWIKTFNECLSDKILIFKEGSDAHNTCIKKQITTLQNMVNYNKELAELSHMNSEKQVDREISKVVDTHCSEESTNNKWAFNEENTLIYQLKDINELLRNLQENYVNIIIGE